MAEELKLEEGRLVDGADKRNGFARSGVVGDERKRWTKEQYDRRVRQVVRVLGSVGKEELKLMGYSREQSGLLLEETGEICRRVNELLKGKKNEGDVDFTSGGDAGVEHGLKWESICRVKTKLGEGIIEMDSDGCFGAVVRLADDKKNRDNGFTTDGKANHLMLLGIKKDAVNVVDPDAVAEKIMGHSGLDGPARPTKEGFIKALTEAKVEGGYIYDAEWVELGLLGIEVGGERLRYRVLVEDEEELVLGQCMG